MENNRVNVLFVCGFGMGTSTLAEIGVSRALLTHNIEANVQHTSLGQMESLRSWADIIVILQNLAQNVKFNENEHVLPVVNIMDSKGIALKVNAIVEEFYPSAKKS